MRVYTIPCPFLFHEIYMRKWETRILLAIQTSSWSCTHQQLLVQLLYTGFNSRCPTFISVCNQPVTKVNSAFHPSGVSKWVTASAGKAKAGMVHSVRHLRSAASGCLAVTGTKTTLGRRNFAVTGATIWNNLPTDLRLHSQSLLSFGQKLKQYLFEPWAHLRNFV